MLVSQSEKGNGIWALPLDPSSHTATGPPVARLVSQAFDCCPHLSFDGSRLAWTSSRLDGIHGWIADADGNHQQELATTVEGRLEAWFPDGKQMIFTKFADGPQQVVHTRFRHYESAASSGRPEPHEGLGILRGRCVRVWNH